MSTGLNLTRTIDNLVALINYKTDMANQPGDKEASLFDINLQLTENGKKVLGEIHPSPEVRSNLHIVGYPCSNQHLSNGMPHISPRPPNLADDLDFDWVEGGLQVEQEYEQYDPVCFFWKNGERVPCMSRLSTAFPLLVPTDMKLVSLPIVH